MGDEGSQPQPGSGPQTHVRPDPGIQINEVGPQPQPGDVTLQQLGLHHAILDEPVPGEPVKIGVDATGTIPQTSAARVWGRAQVANWRLYLIRFLVAGIAVVVTVGLLPGLQFRSWQWGEFVQIAVIFGVLNVTVKPLLQFLSLRFILNTYGLVVVLVNTVVLALLGLLMPDRFQADRPISLLAGGLVVGVLGLVLETLLGANQPVLDREYRERNGLA